MAWIIVPMLGGLFANSANSVMWSLIVFSIGAIIATLCHWRGYRATSEEATRAVRDRLLGRLVQEEWEGGLEAEKSKRHLTLSDDGELVEVETDVLEPESRKRAYE
jgi:hypothetical protein